MKKLMIGTAIAALFTSPAFAAADESTGGAIVLILFVGYFFPVIVSKVRNHRQSLAIGMLNLFLGWTLIGWVAALVWACTTDVDPTVGPGLFKRIERDYL